LVVVVGDDLKTRQSSDWLRKQIPDLERRPGRKTARRIKLTLNLRDPLWPDALFLFRPRCRGAHVRVSRFLG
jgi:hypothetical protein